MKYKIKIVLLLIFAIVILIMRIESSKSNASSNIILVNEKAYQRLGYSKYDLEMMESLLQKNQIDQIIKLNIHRNILFSYFKQKSFEFDNINLYEDIRKTKNVTFKEAINLVNHPYLMSDFYEFIRSAINLNTELILVNKNYYLEPNYTPDNLILSEDLHPLIPKDKSRNYLKEEAYLALKALFNEAENNNLQLYLSNGYRTYEKQDKIYSEYLTQSRDADIYSARPGHSEHQTGLAVDITCQSINYQLIEDFVTTEEGKFIKQNAHRFGFIERYPKDKEKVTGYIYEPWHIRYVGIKAATIIYQTNITLEEYLIKYTNMSK